LAVAVVERLGLGAIRVDFRPAFCRRGLLYRRRLLVASLGEGLELLSVAFLEFLKRFGSCRDWRKGQDEQGDRGETQKREYDIFHVHCAGAFPVVLLSTSPRWTEMTNDEIPNDERSPNAE
jgi:hypothetical protein